MLECRNNSYYAGYYTNNLSREEHEKVKRLMHPKHYLEAIGVGMITYAGLTSVVGSLKQGLTSTKVAAIINAGISTASDCITTAIKGEQCTAKDAVITAGFSLVTGGIRGRVASLFTLDTPESMLGLMGANMLISLGSNTLQRTAKGKNTTEGNWAADIIAGGLATGVQMNPDVATSTSGPIAQAISGVVSALLGTFNPHPGQTIIQVTQ